MDLRKRDFLKLLDYTPEEIRYLLDLAKDFKKKKHEGIEHKYLQGKNIALITDAGTPGISDPGEKLKYPVDKSSPKTPTARLKLCNSKCD